MKKQDLQKLEKAIEVLRQIDGESDLYEELIDCGCQPCTALNSLGEIVSALRGTPVKILLKGRAGFVEHLTAKK